MDKSFKKNEKFMNKYLPNHEQLISIDKVMNKSWKRDQQVRRSNEQIMKKSETTQKQVIKKW